MSALRLLELLECQAAVREGRPASGRDFIPLWNTLLVNQFHDILPGSCISEAHAQCLAEMQAMLDRASPS